MNAVSASDSRDVRARLEAFRQNPRPLVVAPAPPTRRPGDQLDPAIDLVVIAIVLMSIIRTIIFQNDTRSIQGPSGMLANVQKIGRWSRCTAYHQKAHPHPDSARDRL